MELILTFSLLFLLTQLRHTLIIPSSHPNLGHGFYPSSQWFTEAGPIPDYVLAELYSWLESRSGFTDSGSLSKLVNNGTNHIDER